MFERCSGLRFRGIEYLRLSIMVNIRDWQEVLYSGFNKLRLEG